MLFVSLHSLLPGSGATIHAEAITRGLRARGWSVTEVVARSDAGLIKRASGHLRVISSAAFKLLVARPDVVYFRQHPIVLPVVLLAKAMGVPVVSEVNGPYTDMIEAHPSVARAGRLLEAMERATLRSATALVAVSDELARYCGSYGRSDVHVVPNGVDSTRFVRRESADGEESRTSAVFIGELAPWQGVDLMLDASRSNAWPDGVALVIAGSGPLATQVSEAPEPVHYLGRIDHDAVPALLATAAVALSTKVGSGSMASPLKLFEAMAAATPVVVTDVGQQADLVRRYACGRVVAPDDPNALARAVRFFVEDTDAAHAAGDRGRDAVERFHDWSLSVASVDELLSAVVAGTSELVA